MSILRPALSSGDKSADAVISSASCALRGARLVADGTNACTLVIYDNASAASGTVLAKLSVKAGAVVDELNLPRDIHAQNGIFADVTGTGATYIVYYEKHW